MPVATSIQQSKFLIKSGSTQLTSVLTVASPDAPLLVFAHGFAGNKNENGLFTQAKDYFVDKGFSVLRFDFRACGENQGSFKRVRLDDLVSDVKNVFAHLRSDATLTPKSVGFVGFSLGAGIGLLANPPVDAYVFWSPAIYTRLDMVPRYQPELDQKGYVVKGNLEISKQFMHDLDTDAIPHALLGVNTPVLLVHGTADPRIPFHSTEEAQRLLKKASKESQMFLIRDADHSYRQSHGARERLFSGTLTWLKTHLPHHDNRTSTGMSSADRHTRTLAHFSKRSPPNGYGPFMAN